MGGAACIRQTRIAVWIDEWEWKFMELKKSSDEIGLQIIDYYLWAVHRLYEKGDDRYFLPLQDNYSVIIDLDDKRDKRWSGTWYNRKNPLTLEKIKPLTS